MDLSKGILNRLMIIQVYIISQEIERYCPIHRTAININKMKLFCQSLRNGALATRRVAVYRYNDVFFHQLQI
jgi:hypothetical protein